MPRRDLTINLTGSTPFRSSNLAIPPSPFSPRLPLTPPAQAEQQPILTPKHITTDRTAPILPPPNTPMPWIWSCHICHRQYQLGVTRRCLDDGHYFCSGSTVVRRRDGSKRTKKHRACGSEFDYRGWKVRGVWRRGVSLARAAAPEPECVSTSFEVVDNVVVGAGGVGRTGDGSALGTPAEEREAWMLPSSSTQKVPERKNCWMECDYPSECRWGKAYGVCTPVALAFTIPEVPGAGASYLRRSAGLRDDNGGGVKPATDFKDILTWEQQQQQQQGVVRAIDGVAGMTVPGVLDLAALCASARRRKSRTEIVGPSPLATQAHSASATARKDEISTKGWEEIDLSVRADPGDERHESTKTVFGLSKALSDFEFGSKKTLSRGNDIATSAVTSILSSSSGAAALDDDKSDYFVRALRLSSGSRQSLKKDSSISDKTTMAITDR